MLSAAQTNALCAIFTSLRSVFGRVGIRAHSKLAFANLVGPLQNSLKLFCRLGRSQLHCAQHNFTSCAVERNHIALTNNYVASAKHLAVNLHCISTYNSRCSPTASNNCCVTYESTARSQNTFRNHHAVHVFWACLAAHQNNCLATLGGGFGVICSEINFAHRCAWRCRQTFSNGFCLINKLRMQNLI